MRREDWATLVAPVWAILCALVFAVLALTHEPGSKRRATWQNGTRLMAVLAGVMIVVAGARLR